MQALKFVQLEPVSLSRPLPCPHSAQSAGAALPMLFCLLAMLCSPMHLTLTCAGTHEAMTAPVIKLSRTCTMACLGC